MSTNPFDDDHVAPRTSIRSKQSLRGSVATSSNRSYRTGSTSGRRTSSISHQDAGEPAIWAARNVEWPIPSALSLSSYQKLSRASRQAGAALGIVSDGYYALGDEDESGGVGDSQNYYGIAGLMSRVLNTSGTSVGGSGADALQDDVDGGGLSSSPSRSARPLRSPKNRCVAASNGWIVAALDCAPSGPAGGSAGPFLRLVSRWNVRRGSSASFSGDHLIALPPPVLTTRSSTGSGAATPSPGELLATRIAHIFVDPTGCHTLLSAKNGEAYYLHSSSRTIQKLAGFGRAPDGGKSGSQTGVAATTMAATKRSDEAVAAAAVQTGLSPGSYVTAVAWDKERGTEGSTKKILLGTNLGELYEYYLVSPNQSSETVSTGSKATDDDVIETTKGEPMPVLLHKLHSAEASTGDAEIAAVTGVHFERLSSSSARASGGSSAAVTSLGGSGMVILVATSGRNKRTRLFTFYSASGNVAFRTVLSSAASSSSDSNHSSLVELPGSIDFADLRLCGDSFALRTATGIYYGTIDRGRSTGASPAVLSGGSNSSGGVIIESGILPYDKGNGTGSTSATSAIPVSIALTPHHLITLSESSEVRFINRVVQKVIQKERVDWVAMSPATSGGGPTSSVDESLMGYGELMMDSRRLDQCWLRKARALVHISSSCEDRDVWKFSLEKCLELPSSSRGGSSQARTLVRPELARQPSLSATPTIPPLSEEEKMHEALFEHAKSLCSNTMQKAVVTAVRAEYHLSQGRVELAAKYLAQCPPSLAPFANTSIRLALPMLGIDDPKGYAHSAKAKKNLHSSNLALITYLSDKMRVAKMNDDGVVSTMIGAWLTELYLHERERSGGTGLGQAAGSPKKPNRAVDVSNQAMLNQFLSSYVHNMDAKTIMRILSSHDVSAPECASYATASGDIGTAVNAALCIGSDDMTGAQDALRVLDDAPFEVAEPFYYKHASTLLARAPQATSKSFLTRYSDGLSPTKLLPSIMIYERRRAEMKRSDLTNNGSDKKLKAREKSAQEKNLADIEKVRVKRDSLGVEVLIDDRRISHSGSFVDDDSASKKYLEGVIKLGCRSNAIYNYLISLYASMDDEEPLFRFLSTHVPASSTVADATRKALLSRDNRHPYGDDVLSAPLDMSYALRTILGTGRHYRSAIKLYMGFGMRQQAVELALKVDPNLARELARDSVGAEERKRLWLMIARNAAVEGNARGDKDVVAKVVSVLKDCGPEVLTIEDVLPFLPDFAQIDQIKDEISDALTSYSSKIEGLLKEMTEGDQTCDALREEIGRLSTHRMQMKSDARCAFTNKLVLQAGEPFYVFPSGYVVLESALKQEVMPYLNEKQQARVEEITWSMQQLRSKTDAVGLMPAESGSDDLQKMDEMQSELDGLIAAECPLTGSIMVDSIDRGFDDSMDEDEGIWADHSVLGMSSSSTSKADGHSHVGVA